MKKTIISFIGKIKSSAPVKSIVKSRAYKALYSSAPMYAIRYAINYPAISEAIRQIKAKPTFANFDELFSFACDCGNGIIAPMQIKGEIFGLTTLLLGREIKRFMEIGTANGGTLFIFCKTVDEDAISISLDLPGSVFNEGYQNYRIPLYKSFAFPAQTLHFLRENSHDASVSMKVDALLSGEKLDFLFIDGDHTYEGVKKDFEMYSGLVREGGIIAFHDIAVVGVEGCEVKKFWDQIKSGYKYREFISEGECPYYNRKGPFGIGVLFK